jgi:hypothetical protein
VNGEAQRKDAIPTRRARSSLLLVAATMAGHFLAPVSTRHHPNGTTRGRRAFAISEFLHDESFFPFSFSWYEQRKKPTLPLKAFSIRELSYQNLHDDENRLCKWRRIRNRCRGSWVPLASFFFHGVEGNDQLDKSYFLSRVARDVNTSNSRCAARPAVTEVIDAAACQCNGAS